MNRTLKLALSAVLTGGFVISALAQDNFPDVPDNHWAYEALARLKKDGLLVGYPDGLFRGNRPASRYELAVAIHATYVHLKSITDGLQAEIDQLKNGDMANQIQQLKDAVAQLQDEVNSMKGWGADIDNLKKLADQFQKELASLGVDVEGLKKDLADLSKRVGVLEAHRLPFDIHGDASFYLIAGNSSGNKYGLTETGQLVGARLATGISSSTTTFTSDAKRPSTPFNGTNLLTPAGMDQDSAIAHELTLKITSNNDTGPKWHGDIVIGDLLGSSMAPSQSTTAPSLANGASLASQPFGVAIESVYVQDLAVDFDTSIAGQGLAAELGRTGYEVDPYIYKRPDVLPYFTNDRWGDGKWYFDGGILGFHWSGVKLDVFGGKQNQETNTYGVPYQGMTVGKVGVGQSFFGLTPGYGSIPVSQELGLNLGIPLGQNGKLDLAYIWFGSNTGGSVPNASGYPATNRADVYGGDFKYNFGSGFKFNAGYSASDVGSGSHSYTSSKNYAWHAGLGYEAAKWGADAGYRQILPQFGAPGDWGRIGTWWNPTDIEGPWLNAHVKLSDQFTLKASGEWDQGTGTSINLPAIFGGGTVKGVSTNQNVADYKADLGYKLNDAWDFDLGFEYVPLHVPGGPNPYESWYNFGLGYNLSDQARLSFLYQYSAADFKTSSLGGSDIAGKLAGSLLTTQLTVKF